MSTNMPDTITIPLRDWPQEELEGLYRVVGQLCCEIVRLAGLSGKGLTTVEVDVEDGKPAGLRVHSPFDRLEQERGQAAHTELIEKIAERVRQAHDGS